MEASKSRWVTILILSSEIEPIRILFTLKTSATLVEEMPDFSCAITIFVSTGNTEDIKLFCNRAVSINLACAWSVFNLSILCSRAYKPQAAIYPACLIPPPSTFLILQAFRIYSFDPSKTLPVVHLRPLFRQTDFLTSNFPYYSRYFRILTIAYKDRVPYRV